MKPNRLIREKSPYLLQHAHNPVDWHAWTDEAFEKARRENKPIFLSIGYATCHWCHVMERETFEDQEAAAELNATFVCIKVDREERPDIDAVYMAACQMTTGGGGWPLTIFMTPDKKPFFTATYLPKTSRFGRAGVMDLCRQIRAVWHGENEKVLAAAESLAGHLSGAFAFQAAEQAGADLIDRAQGMIARGFDERFGGFENAPKFPTPHRLLFLLRCYHRTGNPQPLAMVEKTLTAMRLGGIWDHVGFGFHRYSTDREWLLPHFEKMLYDQALTVLPYLEAYQITRNPLYAQTARDIFAYVLRDMQSAEGGFFSAEDADSEGEEGRFYVWTEEEFSRVLEAETAARWARVFNLRRDGNFHDEATGRRTGANILHLKRLPGELAQELGLSQTEFAKQWEEVRRRLFAARRQRVHPLKDDKVLTDWNGLMMGALALGGRVLQAPEATAAAVRAFTFIQKVLRSPDGRLRHRFRDGEAAVAGHAEDYAYLIFGLLELFQATFDPTFIEEAIALQTIMLTDFWDSDAGGFFTTDTESSELPVRPKELYDGALPSANSMALFNLLRLARLTGDAAWEARANAQLKAFAGSVADHPPAFTHFLTALDFALNPGHEVVITGEPSAEDTLELLQAMRLQFTPNGVTLVKTEQNAERLAGVAGYTGRLPIVAGQATAHICRGFACKQSATDAATLVKQILGDN